jgi:hypothetical protein
MRRGLRDSSSQAARSIQYKVSIYALLTVLLSYTHHPKSISMNHKPLSNHHLINTSAMPCAPEDVNEPLFLSVKYKPNAALNAAETLLWYPVYCLVRSVFIQLLYPDSQQSLLSTRNIRLLARSSCDLRRARVSRSWWAIGRSRRGGACGLVCWVLLAKCSCRVWNIGRARWGWCQNCFHGCDNQVPEGTSGFVDGN